MIRIRPARRGRLVASAAALCLLLTGCAGQAASTPDPAASASAAQAQRSREARAAEASASRAAASSSAEAVRASAAAEKSAAAEASAQASRAAAEEAAAEEAARAQAEAETAAAQAAAAEEAARVAEEERLAQEAVVAEGLDDSPPVSFTIPSIGAGSDLMRLLLRDDGSLAVPPAEPGSPAAWYANSPSPGQRGPAVLLGHVNATDGSAGVFAHLTDLAPGDTIEVEREDGAVAVFAVDRGVTYSKDEFPTDEVYGDTDSPELRLITCDGYNAFTREFEENHIVYATLVDVY
ncbi:class F sortase [Micrococcus luteus]|uniref:class F sortase n=1 Tax=Micrococcus luteus TaxID=1270 RepID=UPI000B18FB4A|nr:class F sortase [Micrococcus luteus]MCV7715702.1 class F sortase [Micrococcus luteus]